MPMIFDMPTCGGCRTCEIACSFKHKGEFAPSISSIKILDKKDGLGFFVQLVEQNEGTSMACDGCKERDVPLCMEYCKKEEDLEKIIKEFLKPRGDRIE
jgi:Fe-S-cluster-containing hydrogenase component 2